MCFIDNVFLSYCFEFSSHFNLWEMVDVFCWCVLLIVEMIKKIGQNDLHFLFGNFPVLGKMKQTIEENVRERKKKQKC